MEEILPNMEKIIIDGKGGERLLPYLPLDRHGKPPSMTGARTAPQPETEETRTDPSPTMKQRGARS
jgi:membrane protease subunit HflK